MTKGLAQDMPEKRIAKRRVLAFGSFEVDLHAGELRRDGVALRLQQKPFRALELLLDRCGESVTREELRAALWPDDVFVDVDHNINSAIRRLRDVLEDCPNTPHYIETLPRGYRFIAPVRELLPTSEPLSHSAISLAVLPFENVDGDPMQEYFSDGFTEEMIAQFGRVNPCRMTVVGLGSARLYRRTQKSLAQVGTELRADYILQGSIRRLEDRMLIVAHLVQVAGELSFGLGTTNEA